ncbi:hypothetical protein Zm00014a_007459 [Zea mays]|uniref:Uncharacterized protein n=1 Tax=Zea mays TaxID=4577 RepID=A0A3L6G9S3_MAIZE|nr:hypothetical protein Zm00014a_007459 [Zea mays]
MEKFLKRTGIHGLWLLSMILFASSVIHARIISGQIKEDTNARSLTMTTVMSAGDNTTGSVDGEASSGLPSTKYFFGFYLCKKTDGD